jgi:hypothetical protein
MISEIMIAQFFHEVEGPDRDWGEEFDFDDDDLNFERNELKVGE